jgi:hypothetical protein
MNQISSLNLKKNPFELITPSLYESNQGSLIWAGIPKLKKQLEDEHKKNISSLGHQIVLNWGAWGAGKTYAAYYFSKDYLQKNYPELDGNIFHFYVRLPKNGNEATKQFFKDILDYLSLSTIRERIQYIISETNEKELYDFLNNRIRSEEYAKAIIKLADTDVEISEMMARYLYVGSTKTELKKLGLSRSLASDIDLMKVLTGILLCLVSIPHFAPKGRIFIWIDEMEDLIYYNSKQYRPFSQTLRDLFDQMSESLTVFMNFTLAQPEEKTVRLLIGEALWSRITQKIRFSELSIKDGMLYCKELLQPYQIEQLDEYSPFNEKSLHSLLEMIPAAEMTPREINKVCNEVLNFTISKNTSTISEEIIQQWISQKAEQE